MDGMDFMDSMDDMDGMDMVGGMEVAKGWCIERRRAFSEAARAFGLPWPKGVLITGIPGTGKSLVATCLGAAWELPVLRVMATVPLRVVPSTVSLWATVPARSRVPSLRMRAAVSESMELSAS